MLLKWTTNQLSKNICVICQTVNYSKITLQLLHKIYCKTDKTGTNSTFVAWEQVGNKYIKNSAVYHN